MTTSSETLLPEGVRVGNENLICLTEEAGNKALGLIQREDEGDYLRIKISGGGFVGTGANKDDIRKMREVVRQRIAYHASARTYRPILAATGHEWVISKLHALSIEGKWDELAKHVPDDMVDALTVVAEYDEIAPIFKERYGDLLDEVAPEFHTPNPMPPEIEARIIRELKE